jgi:hypothetical protein
MEMFGSSIELHPRGEGERVSIRIDESNLEILGLGSAGRLEELADRAMSSRLKPEAFLVLVPSGDEDTWQEAKSISNRFDEDSPDVPVRTWVFSDPTDITREKAKKELVALLDDQLIRL